MKRIIKYTIGIFAGFGMLYSCTGKFEDMNTSGIQVNPADLPLSAQCAEPIKGVSCLAHSSSPFF